MPRLQPPAGYITAKEAQERLNVSDTVLRRHVQSGELKRYGPVNRTHRPWYKVEEIEALLHAQQILEPAKQKISSTSFELAREEDMPAIIDIDKRTFREPAASLEVCLSWYHKNPHTFYVLRDDKNVVVAYASLIPMGSVFIDQIVTGEMASESLTTDMIDEYVTGKPLNIYVMAIAVDPDCDRVEKKVYGGRVILGLFRFLLELASRGIDIRTITARNYMQDWEGGLRLPDGLHLLRKIGFTQVKSAVPGIGLFVINIPESGVPVFNKYSELLQDWRDSHREAV